MIATTRTARLLLRPAESSDLPVLGRLLGQEEVRRFLCDGRMLPAAEIRALIERSGAQPEGAGLAILSRSSDPSAPIDLAGLMPVIAALAGRRPDLAGRFEPVVALEPLAWGQGLATEALAAILAGSRARGIAPPVATADLPNLRSDAMLRRLGFRPAESFPGGAYEIRLYRAPGETPAESASPGRRPQG